MFLHKSTKSHATRRGAIVLFVAVCLTVLLGFAAIALDGGVLLTERRHAQATVDAAALAAACDLYKNYGINGGLDNSAGTAKASALSTAAANGYANDGTTSVVTVNIPPISGDYVGKAGYAEVIVQFNETRGFSNVFGSGSTPVQARAVARGAMDARANPAILILDPSGASALSVSGTPSITTNSTIVVDSNNSQAASASGNAQVNAPETDITGDYTTSGGGTFFGKVNVGQASTPDPLASLPAPDPASLTVQSNSALSYGGQSSVTLNPGVYKGGISASSGAAITLSPGIYYLDGGGLSVGGQASITGNGVMIYNAPKTSSDSLDIGGGGTITLSGPTSGAYAGISLFQDRNSSVGATLSGGSQMNITGTFYFAGAPVKITGNSSTAVIGSQYISRDLTIGGTASLTVTWDSSKVARQRAIYLVE
ncbi:MAG: pilus assembly protein TadG-related protein [Gemmataceae bacterium]